MLWFPSAVAVDDAGNIFIADQGNNRIRVITTAATIMTVAGSFTDGTRAFTPDGYAATISAIGPPEGVAIDASGNLFLGDTQNNRVAKVNAVLRPLLYTMIRSVVGIGPPGFQGDGGLSGLAQLTAPGHVLVDPSGNLLIADTGNSRIRKVSPDMRISTVAGSNTAPGFGGDGGPATAARLAFPRNIALDRAGNLFIADSANYRVRKVAPNGLISTVAGSDVPGLNGDGGPASSAQLMDPAAVAVDAAGNLFVADMFRIRKINVDGIISTVAGGGTNTQDGIPATSAQLGGAGTSAGPRAIALDDNGNLYIADTGNHCIRMVDTNGIITTIAGTGTPGFSGDGGVAVAAQFVSPRGIAIDPAGNVIVADTGNNRIRRIGLDGIITTIAGTGTNDFYDGPALASFLSSPSGVAADNTGAIFVADAGNNRIRKIATEMATYVLPEAGGLSLLSSGGSGTPVAGYGSIQADSGSTLPAGLAILGFRRNGVLVTEASVSATSLIRSGRIYAEVAGPVNTGLAIANPNAVDAAISITFTAGNGNVVNGSLLVSGHGQISKFLSEQPFNIPASSTGALTFISSVPVAVVALRGFTNEHGDFLITTLPVVDLGTAPVTTPVVLPHFADGGGWATQIALVNPTDTVLSGTIQFFDRSGQAVTVIAGGAYSIPARSSTKFQTPGTASAVLTGTVRVMPAAGNVAPSGVAIVSFRINDVTIDETGVPLMPAGSGFRLYVEAAGSFDEGTAGSIETGIAITNTSSGQAPVVLELSTLDGSSTGLTATIPVPSNGQVSNFLNQIPGFAALPVPFQGILRVSSAAPIAIIGVRGRYNESKNFLFTTTPPVDESSPPVTSALYFPLIADWGGFTTQLVLFNIQSGQSQAGTLKLYSQSGSPLSLTMR
jgi:sugar lactone lactonase YvrE